MNAEDWKKLSEQLGRLPGGAAAVIPDFFGGLVSDALAPVTSDWDYDGWLLRDGNVLSLRLDDAIDGLRLCYVTPDGDLEIARAGNELLQVARADGISALTLLLIAIASGQVDDRRRLKIELPALDAAARDLMLMTVCRLCG